MRTDIKLKERERLTASCVAKAVWGAMKIWILMTVLTLSNFGCAKPTVDTSSDEAMKASVEAMKEGMTPEQIKEFEQSTQTLLLSEFDLKAIMSAAFRGDELDTQSYVENMKTRIDGMTVDQIIAEAARVGEERGARELEQVRSEISELEAKLAEMLKEKEKADALQAEIAKIEISGTRLYWKELTEYSFSRDLSLEVTVKNNLDVATSRIYMTGTLATPGRSVPWLVEDFNYKIAGGLEPGEQQSWNLAPNEYSGDWRNTPKDRNDTIFTVVVRNAEGPDGEELFDIDYDEVEFKNTVERLDGLRESLSTLTQTDLNA